MAEVNIAHNRAKKIREQLGLLGHTRMVEEQQNLLNNINHAEKMAKLEYEMQLRKFSLEQLERQEQMARNRHRNVLKLERSAIEEDLVETHINLNAMFNSQSNKSPSNNESAISMHN